ncbi:MAG: glycosyltransferase family 4 protein [Anaerolineales bacterium]|nr:glycosyltransferase family 4 protein [Anaerolineales bacterium]
MPEKLRVVQMVYSFDTELGGGGITRFTTGLAKRLSSEKFDVSLWALGFYGTQSSQRRIQELNAQGIRAYTATNWVENKPYQSFSRAIKTLLKEFTDNPVDIIHSHSEFADVAALILKIRSKASKIVRTVHNGYWKEWRRRPLRRLVFTNFLYPIYYDCEIGVSPAIKERLSQRYLARLLQRAPLYINNAVELERFSNLATDPLEIKRSLGIPENATLVGTVGRLVIEKGYEDLLEAAAIVLRSRLQVYFMIVGGGPLEDALKRKAEQLGIASRVIFTGPRSDIEEILSCMDLFVSSSLWEGLPTAVLESMSASVPVVATRIPGAQALIQHGENGLLVPTCNPNELSSAILKLIDSPSMRMDFAERSLKIVQDFSIDKVARTHEELYLSIGAQL